MAEYKQFFGAPPPPAQLQAPPNVLGSALAHMQQSGTNGYGKTSPQQLARSFQQGQQMRNMATKAYDRLFGPSEPTPPGPGTPGNPTTPGDPGMPEPANQVAPEAPPEPVPGDPMTPMPANPVEAAPSSSASSSAGVMGDAAGGLDTAGIAAAAPSEAVAAPLVTTAGVDAGGTALTTAAAGEGIGDLIASAIAYVAPLFLAAKDGGIADYRPNPRASGGIADYAPHIRAAGAGSRGGRSHLSRGPKAFMRGLVRSPTPGRADHVRTAVRRGSYVVPADVVSGLGQGNTDAGAATLHHAVAGHGVDDAEEYASGGIADVTEGMPVALSGGEFVLTPREVRAIGGGRAEHGAALLDDLVHKVRRSTTATLRQLPPPK